MKLLGKAHHPNFWKEVREADHYRQYREELLNTWEEETKDYCPDCLRYSDFKLFFTSGDRDTYQKPYFHRRHMAENAALLSLVYPEEQKYVDKLMDILFAVCDEYTWCIPAHQVTLDDNDNSHIDLFASETGFMLAEMDVLLKDRMDPLIHNRIMAEVERRIVKPFLAKEPYDWWEEDHINWTAVCMCSVACTFMLLYPELVDEAFLNRANTAMESFLSGFGEDGFCLEGCGYWRYGFGFFVMYADMLRSFTDGRIDFFQRDKVRTIATFPQKMFLSGNAGVSFADCGRTRTIDYITGLMHFLKTQYPEHILIYSPEYGTNGVGKFPTHLRSATWMVPDYKEHPADNSASVEYYGENSQWLVKRTSHYGFAAKGGCNNEPHNHNDVGSFVFAKNGKQILMDPGSGRYTRQYFMDEIRYSMVECSSRGHSVPMIGDTCQFFGDEARAADVTYENGVFSMNIAGAYRCEGLERIDRRFTPREDSVTLEDRYVYQGTQSITERIVTLIKPEIISDHVVKVDDVTITYDPAQCTCEINKEVTSLDKVCYFIVFRLAQGQRIFECTIR